MSRRPQFSLRTTRILLLAAMLAGCGFFAGRHFERRQRMVDREHYATSLEALEGEHKSLRQNWQDLLDEKIAREKKLAAQAEENAKAEKHLLELEAEYNRQRGIYDDKRWKIRGAIRRGDGTFYRDVQRPDGSPYEEPIPPIP